MSRNQWLLDVEQDTEKEVGASLETLLEPPWKIFVHNDDVTPYDFVVLILQNIFQLSAPEAEAVTFTAHMSGIAYVTTLPRAQAVRLVGKAHFAAGLEGYPLKFSTEPE